MRKVAVFLVTTVGLLMVSAPAQADYPVSPSPVSVWTPNGFLSPVRKVFAGQTFPSPSVPGATVTVSVDSYLPDPNVPIPALVTYVDSSHEAVVLGTTHGLELAGSLNTPVAASSCPGGGEYLVAATGSVLVADTYLPAGTTDLTGVTLQPLQPGGTVLTTAQVTALGWWDDDGLVLFVTGCDGTGAPSLESGTGATQRVIGLTAAATYLPNATAGGDPWMRFHNMFRSETRLIVRTKAGKLVRVKDLGWLASGGHKASFLCATLRGTFYVHVHGVAKDGAGQSSPVRTVTC